MLHNLFLICKPGVVVTSSPPPKMGSNYGGRKVELGSLVQAGLGGWHRWSVLKKEWDFPGGPVAKTRTPNAGSPGQETRFCMLHLK